MKRLVSLLAVLSLPLFAGGTARAESLKLVVTIAQDPRVEGARFEVLSRYLALNVKLIDGVKMRIAKDYNEAAALFQAGEADGMVAGSFLAGAFVRKGSARAIARPLRDDGTSTYKTVIVARAGTRPFAGIDDFKGKKVAYPLLASSGEGFVRALLPAGKRAEELFTPVPVPNHQAAINAVQNGAADYGVCKDTVWASGKYPGLVAVGGERPEREYPDGTLILSSAAFARYGKEVKEALLRLEEDASPLAAEVKKAFSAKSFIPTSAPDFSRAYELIERSQFNLDTFKFPP